MPRTRQFSITQSRTPRTLGLLALGVGLLPTPSVAQDTGNPHPRLYVRPCGLKRASSMLFPHLSNINGPRFFDPRDENPFTADRMLMERIERANLLFPNQRFWSIQFLSDTPAHSEIRDGDSFPALDVPQENSQTVAQDGMRKVSIACERAWQMGDTLYYNRDEPDKPKNRLDVLDIGLSAPESDLFAPDQNGDPADAGTRTRVREQDPELGAVLLPLSMAQKAVFGFVDHKDREGNLVGRAGKYDVGDHIYRLESRVARLGLDAVLVSPIPDSGAQPSELLFTEDGKTVRRALYRRDINQPVHYVDQDFRRVMFIDHIEQPPLRFSLGYPKADLGEVYFTSVENFENTRKDPSELQSPAYGQYFEHAAKGGAYQTEHCFTSYIVADDPSRFLPEQRVFEGRLIAHELAHAVGLPHGNGVDDDNMNGVDDRAEDQVKPASAGPSGVTCEAGTRERECCYDSNVMQECWADPGDFTDSHDLAWVGPAAQVDRPVMFSASQIRRMLDRIDYCDRTGRNGDAFRMVMGVTDSVADVDVNDTWLNIVRIGLREATPELGSAIDFFVSFLRPDFDLPREPFETIFAIDADGDLATGGPLRAFDPAWGQDSFEGVDLVLQVLLTPNASGEVELTLNTFLYDASSSSFVPPPNPLTPQLSFTPMGSDPGFTEGYSPDEEPWGDLLNINFAQNTFPIPLGSAVSMVVSTKRPGAPTWTDRAEALHTRSGPKDRPEHAACQLLDASGEPVEIFEPGSSLRLQAQGLRPNTKVGLRIDHRLAPAGDLRADAQGRLSLQLGDELSKDKLTREDGSLPERLAISATTNSVMAQCEVVIKEDTTDPYGDCMLDMACHHRKACAPGNFRYLPACGSLSACPDGAPMLAGCCPVPLSWDGDANCINAADNLYRLASGSVDGTIYNQEPRRADGSPCHAIFGNLDAGPVCGNPELSAKCLEDKDQDGIPDKIDPCPMNSDPGCGLKMPKPKKRGVKKKRRRRRRWYRR